MKHHPELLAGKDLAALFKERDELRASLTLARSTVQFKSETLTMVKTERDELRAALTDLMPFATEDYYESCATPAYKHAVERARKALDQ